MSVNGPSDEDALLAALVEAWPRLAPEDGLQIARLVIALAEPPTAPSSQSSSGGGTWKLSRFDCSFPNAPVLTVNDTQTARA